MRPRCRLPLCGVVMVMLLPILQACAEEAGPRPWLDASGADAANAPDAADAGIVDRGPDRALDAPPALDAGGDAGASDAQAKPDAQVKPDAQAKPDAAVTPGELLLFDKQGLKFSVADNGFHPLIKPGDPLPASNWSSPRDYYNGELRIRYVITAPPTQAAGKLQVCIWTMGNADGDGKDYFPESCAGQVAHTGVGTYYDTKLSPSGWWNNGGVPLVFSHPERFLIRVVLRGSSGCNVTTYSVAGACWSEWPSYQNMTFRVTLVLVPKGETFSGWSSYP